MKIQSIKLLISNNSELGPLGEQCDCACAGRLTFGTENQNLEGRFLRAVKVGYQEIATGYVLALNPRYASSPAILTSAGCHKLGSFRHPRRMTHGDDPRVIRKMLDLGFLIMDEDARMAKLESSSVILSAWLHVTDRCNLRCSYCYLPHVSEDMSLVTGHAAINALFRSAKANHFKQVMIKYAGGEPLLQYPLILELHKYAGAVAEQQGLELNGVVLSNGTLLTHEIAAVLKSLNIGLMISLDGYGAYHDKHRPYAGGRGSFVDVAEAVETALASGLIPKISVTVSSRAVDGLPKVMSWVLERELPFSLNFYRENEFSTSHRDMRLDEEKIMDGMLGAFKVIEDNLPRRPFLGGIIDRADLSAGRTHTCGVGQNYLVFDQNGQVAKCQMHIRKPITNSHAADPLEIIRADKDGIQNMSVNEKEGCKTCRWKYWCAGGCPTETHRATGRYDVNSPNCNIYKALYPEALRLEGLRLLKYQDDPEVVERF